MGEKRIKYNLFFLIVMLMNLAEYLLITYFLILLMLKIYISLDFYRITVNFF